MDRALRWKTLALALLVIVSAAYLVPSAMTDTGRLPRWYSKLFSKKMQLGLDLQGGLHIVYALALDKAVEDKAGELARDIDAKLTEQKIPGQVTTPRRPLGAIAITVTNPSDTSKVAGKFISEYDELEQQACPAGAPANQVCARVSSSFADKIKESALDQAVKTIKERVDRYGVAEPTILKKGDDIVVELPGLKEADINRLKSIIDRAAQLEFKIVDDNAPFMQNLAKKVDADPRAKAAGIEVDTDAWDSEEKGERHSDVYLIAKDKKVELTKEEAERANCYRPDLAAPGGKYYCPKTGDEILKEYLGTLAAEDPQLKPDDNHEFGYEQLSFQEGQAKAPEKRWRTYYMFRTTELSGTAVSSADVTWNPTTGRPEVLVAFNRFGARRFGDLTTRNVGRKMAIILDSRINSAPIIQTAITGGKSTITMGGSDPQVIQAEAQDLVNVLRTGALPAPLSEQSSSKVGATLGQDAIDKAKLSMMVGAAAVILLMLYFYKVSGVIACFAMGMNILFQMSILAALQATLTLPGIAALVLTIGMAVDSNIIIYERVREELRAGKSIRGAVDAGFSRAFWTVFDAHVTNFVAAFVLMEYGTGPIRGFAVMLLIGVVCNLFTSTWVSRLMFEHYIGRKRTAAATISI